MVVSTAEACASAVRLGKVYFREASLRVFPRVFVEVCESILALANACTRVEKRLDFEAASTHARNFDSVVADASRVCPQFPYAVAPKKFDNDMGRICVRVRVRDFVVLFFVKVFQRHGYNLRKGGIGKVPSLIPCIMDRQKCLQLVEILFLKRDFKY